ncbi:hypothetical protein [Streptomyces sp. NPDC051636]|uniref:hypothetical protein n=1 Tax=Streptomyces sp. NPDC051636 TaxID=3365663 RepID=UPI0037A4257E
MVQAAPGAGRDVAGDVAMSAPGPVSVQRAGGNEGRGPRRADGQRQRPRQDLLGGLGHRPRPDEPRTAPITDRAVDHDQDRQHGQVITVADIRSPEDMRGRRHRADLRGSL